MQTLCPSESQQSGTQIFSESSLFALFKEYNFIAKYFWLETFLTFSAEM